MQPIPTDPLAQRVLLNGLKGVGPVTVRRLREAFGGGYDPALELYVTDADQRCGQVGERREVTGSADRSLGRDARIDPAVIERDQRIDRVRMHARASPGEAGDLQHEDQAHSLVAEQRAGARRVGQHEVGLELGKVRVRDLRLCELAEPGIDPVGRFSGRDYPFDRSDSSLQLRHAGRVERNRRAVARNAPQRREREGLLSDEQRVH